MFPPAKAVAPAPKSLKSIGKSIRSLQGDDPAAGAPGADGSTATISCPSCGASMDLQVSPSAGGDAGAPPVAAGGPGGAPPMGGAGGDDSGGAGGF